MLCVSVMRRGSECGFLCVGVLSTLPLHFLETPPYLRNSSLYNLGTQPFKAVGLSQEQIEHVRKQFNRVSLHWSKLDRCTKLLIKSLLEGLSACKFFSAIVSQSCMIYIWECKIPDWNIVAFYVLTCTVAYTCSIYLVIAPTAETVYNLPIPYSVWCLTHTHTVWWLWKRTYHVHRHRFADDGPERGAFCNQLWGSRYDKSDGPGCRQHLRFQRVPGGTYYIYIVGFSKLQVQHACMQGHFCNQVRL